MISYFECHVKPVVLVAVVSGVMCFRGKCCTATSDISVLMMLWLQWLVNKLNLWLLLNSVKLPSKQGYLLLARLMG